MATRGRKRRRSESQASQHAGQRDESDASSKLAQSDFICPICFELWNEVYSTICGHSFCFRCITRALGQSHQCPVCKSNLPLQNAIHPNFSLNDLVTKYRIHSDAEQRVARSSPKVEEVLQLSSEMSVPDVQRLVATMQQRVKKWEEQEKSLEDEVLLDFLREGKRLKLEEMETVRKQLGVLEDDISSVEKWLVSEPSSTQGEQAVVPTTSLPPPPSSLEASSSESASSTTPLPSPPPPLPADSPLAPVLAQRKNRVHSNFQEILQHYFDTRLPRHTGESAATLNDFGGGLRKFTRFTTFREVSSLTYADQTGGCNIVSSIEFDKDGDFFAVAGVNKKIKIFCYSNIIRNTGFHNHFPNMEISCNSKLSSVCYNPYHKATLASSDYEGCITLWDTNSGRRITSLQEHSKRVWSVVFNPMEPNMFASGSDDCTVKLWWANQQHCIFTLPTKANVCSVKFADRYHLAYGSADHCIHYVDLRSPNEPLQTLKGHRKAVSYVQFIGDNELVSASTDSELKLWDVSLGQCLRTFKGHVNEKNFVGLTVTPNFIACGSENNSFYVYSKVVSNPMLQYQFNIPRSVLPELGGSGEDQQAELTDFVSSVCWKKNSNIVVAANSQGHIKVLEMT